MKFLAIAIALDQGRQQVVTHHMEVCFDIISMPDEYQTIHDLLATEIQPQHALIQEIILVQEGVHYDNNLVPYLHKKLRSNVDYQPCMK